MNKNIYKLLVLTAFLFLGSCETIDLDQTENPSALNERFLDPLFAYNYVQLQLPDFVDTANFFTQRVTRQLAMTGGNTYDNAFAPVNSNTNWSIGYNILNAIKISEPIARKNGEFYIVGATKLIRCYVLLTLVDLYGSIPVTEALQGNANLTPKYDKDSDVYKKIISELDEAIALLIQSPSAIDVNSITNLYYSDGDSWIKFANTLKLKIYNNCRLAPGEIGISDLGLAFSSIITSGKYIKEPADDFVFNYTTSQFNPNTRHPLYNDQYEFGVNTYISNYFLWSMTIEKTVDGTNIKDPRENFYFYKQSQPSTGDTNILPGRSRPAHYNDSEYSSFYNSSILTPYVVSNWYTGTIVSNGFWGRDHGDNSGIPQDFSKRTLTGVYPVGGKYGTDAKPISAGDSDGGKGQGIMPMMLSSYVHFICAEAFLTIPGASLNAIADAKTEFLLGVSQSINKVKGFLPNETSLTTAELTTLTTDISKYNAFLILNYDSYNATKKLELVMKEYYLASWGNGIEPYNNYRRTGYPSNMQPTLEAVSGSYYYTAFYPGSAVNNNPNVPSNQRTRKLFWDKANLNLH